MGISLSIPCDPCINKVFHWLDKKESYTHNLKKNLVVLETTMEELKAKRDDLSRRITREEDRGLQRLAEIQVWLTTVIYMEKEVGDLLSERNVELQRFCLCGFCSKSLISSNRYGKRVFLKLGEVENLKNRVFEVVTEQADISEVEERPPPPIIVGQEIMLDTAWKHLMKDGVGIMGMYGMGGVGKTTLLTQLNNKFSNLSRGTYDFVIWVVVSKELHVEKIQDEIAEKLGLHGGGWNEKEESKKAIVIYNFLKKKRFVLFLDDIWEEVDLAKIGIPTPTSQNGCKVAFTTRSQNVCSYMRDDDPMEVQCLSENEAFDLFQKKVGQKTLGSHPEIPNLARLIAKECCGLPLALNVIGKTMSCKKTIHEWRLAIADLTSNASKFPDMEEKVLQLLKYSYDDLNGEEVKSCLLYCALFPEDDEIPKKKLIEYWICEGIINGSEGIERAENEGYEIIGSLVRASLLMEPKWGEYITRFDCVSMHDVVREMALWIATDLGREKEAFIVRAGVGLNEMPKVENWNNARRMSLMKNKIHHLDGSPECLELTTLLVQGMDLRTISREFFKSMPELVVLDLSDNNELYELPEGISKLVSLQYLNLSRTGIRRLPRGLQELKKLIHLDLEHTQELKSIAGISSLHSLKVLKLYASVISLDLSTVEELETLERLEILTISIALSSCIENFLSSHRLTRCTQILKIHGVYMESYGIAVPLNMGKLRKFFISGCTISEICINSKTVSPLQNPRNTCFLSLSKVVIIGCKGLKELTWLMFAPNLEDLKVSNSSEVEDIINREKACEGEDSGIVPFRKLIKLSLQNLPELKNIYWSPLPFPCLERIHVEKCPNLKKLPLDSQSGKQGENRLIISYGEKEWIDGLEWEDEATKTRFCEYKDL